jgi:hypothetical protein
MRKSIVVLVASVLCLPLAALAVAPPQAAAALPAPGAAPAPAAPFALAAALDAALVPAAVRQMSPLGTPQLLQGLPLDSLIVDRFCSFSCTPCPCGPSQGTCGRICD